MLVGTTSIENSELLSGMLAKEKLPHQVLNAKQHAREAEIVAQAGRPQMVTIATNMAGRGTDIVLGGNVEKQVEMVEATEGLSRSRKAGARVEKLRGEWQALHDQVIAAGGLHIIGTERHESRRVDNQLRGRSGRQGDPGSSRFFLALEDPLLRIFAGDRINRIMVMLKMPEGEAIEHSMVTRSIESAQRKVEARNFDIRKQLLEYDDVANDQRKTIYALRNELLESEDVRRASPTCAGGVVTDLFRQYRARGQRRGAVGRRRPGDRAARRSWSLRCRSGPGSRRNPSCTTTALLERIVEAAQTSLRGARSRKLAQASFRQYERYVMLQILDPHWREHLAALDHLRQGIHLRGYAQKNPKQEYKREAFELFGAMLEAVKLEVTKILMRCEIRAAEEAPPIDDKPHVENVRLQHADYDEALAAPERPRRTRKRSRSRRSRSCAQSQKIGRNDPCPCGSGKKYKHCHGKLA